ncbi:MAG: hypothetical protein R8N24_00880 [Alphaproteobacteria bacterium]|nr:hypothetical protein [Alphaproteobacteria bacterium]
MKKIFIILLCMITLNVSATEMCARNDTVVIPLDSTINQNAFYANAIEWLWWSVYNYGTVYGASTCLSKKEMLMYSDWNGDVRYTPAVLNTSTDEFVGLSGYYMNADTNPDIPDDEKPDYERRFVYAKLTHPMSSNWGHVYSWSSARDCTKNIYDYPYHYNSFLFKKSIFNSIGTIPPWTE